MIDDFIRFVLGNFTLTFLVLGFAASGIALLRRPRPRSAAVVVEDVFAWFVFFSIGVSYLIPDGGLVAMELRRDEQPDPKLKPTRMNEDIGLYDMNGVQQYVREEHLQPLKAYERDVLQDVTWFP